MCDSLIKMYTLAMKRILQVIIGLVISMGGMALGYFAITSTAEMVVKLPVVCLALGIITVGVTVIFQPKHIKDAFLITTLFQ